MTPPHDLLGEPFPGEVAGRLRIRAATRDDPLCPVALALERLERSVHHARLEVRLHQVVADERIPAPRPASAVARAASEA